MPYWIFPRSAFSGQLSQDRLTGTEKQANRLCQLPLSIKALSLSPNVGQTWQRMCRKVYLSGRLQDTQPSSVLLPDPLPEPGEFLQCSSFETPSTARKETTAPRGLSSSWQAKRVTAKRFWWAFAKNLQWWSIIVSEQGRTADRNAKKRTAQKQTHTLCSSRVNTALRRTAHLQLFHSTQRGTPSTLLLRYRQV